MRVNVKPLPAGRYLLKCRDRTILAAAVNGHSAIWPEAEARSDGELVTFYRDGKKVYLCNATYAAYNFEVVKLSAER